jgi:hypothetical protein
MKFNTPTTKVKTIKQGDSLWYINNGLTIVPRAGFEINKECPYTYRDIIAECVNRGWLTPIAHMRDDEYMWESLKE